MKARCTERVLVGFPLSECGIITKARSRARKSEREDWEDVKVGSVIIIELSRGVFGAGGVFRTKKSTMGNSGRSHEESPNYPGIRVALAKVPESWKGTQYALVSRLHRHRGSVGEQSTFYPRPRKLDLCRGPHGITESRIYTIFFSNPLASELCVLCWHARSRP